MPIAIQTSNLKNALESVFSDTNVIGPALRAQKYAQDVAPAIYNVVQGIEATQAEIISSSAQYITPPPGSATIPSPFQAKILSIKPILNQSSFKSELQSGYLSVLNDINSSPTKAASAQQIADLESDMVTKAINNLLITNAKWTINLPTDIVQNATLASISFNISGTLQVTTSGLNSFKSTMEASLFNAYNLQGPTLKSSQYPQQAQSVAVAYLQQSSVLKTFIQSFQGQAQVTISPASTVDTAGNTWTIPPGNLTVTSGNFK